MLRVFKLYSWRSGSVLRNNRAAHGQIFAMLRCCPRLLILSVLLLFAACSTARQGAAPLRAPAPAQKSTPSPSESGAKLPAPADKYTVLVDSAPTGGIVVVNGVPVGRTPQSVSFLALRVGFSAKPLR